MTGIVFDIKEFSLHDGPGARTTVFLKGCPLRCIWCHNPEGLNAEPQLLVKHNLCTHCNKCKQVCNHPECAPFNRCLHACPNGLLSVSGRYVSSDELAKSIMENNDIFTQTNGGVTFSGGEPLMQSSFLLETISKLNCHIAIQTSGYAKRDVFKEVINSVDYVMMDIKLADKNIHKKYTGVYNDIILENFQYLKNSGKEYVIRTPMIKNICDTAENLNSISQIIGDSHWEKLPENTLRQAKYDMLITDA